jgi:DNA polymerase elongation subunit (family B)
MTSGQALGAPTAASEPETGAEPLLFGPDLTPGIVSVSADRQGEATVWRREPSGGLAVEQVHFPNWFFLSEPALLAELPHQRQGPEFLTAARQAWPRPELPEGLALVELSGEQPFKYLVLAERLERHEAALLAAAGRLSGGRPTSLGSVRELILWRPPVEQYLSWSGRTYFKGLRYDDLHRLQFDLETTGLDERRERIFMISLRDNRGWEALLDAGSLSEKELLEAFVGLVRERDPDVLENHNVFDFDIRFLIARASRLGVRLVLGRDGSEFSRSPDQLKVGERSLPFTRYSLRGREIIDTLHAVRRYGAINRDLRYHGLKEAARYFGFARDDREYVPGAEIWNTFQTDPERIRRYAGHDVEEVDELSCLLMGASFALASMVPKAYERVATSGTGQGLIEPLLVRAYLQAGSALPRGQAAGASYAGGRTELFCSGVLRHVVKADVASLYPSLMLAFGIGPGADRLGAFLSLLRSLTRLRLEHKTRARQAPPGSHEQAFHEALQAAMKQLINSFYGSLGTSFALFADLRAAAEVTRRGRDVLGLMLAELERRGPRLIEADTDGVLFATPEDWSEADERRLIDEVSAALPAGIEAEHDGRFAAMYSYSEKNYILQAYDGRLKIVGVALRSSKLEPYGERFIAQAAPHVLAGDAPALRALYQQTVADLRARRVPVEDLCTRVITSKNTAQYRASKRREEQYEVLLAAGREDWRSNERVTYYQARDRRKKLLEQYADDYDAEYYVKRLQKTYCQRFAKAFTADDFTQIFREGEELDLFGRDLAEIRPIWSRERELFQV